MAWTSLENLRRQKRRAGQCVDPLQRRLAGDGQFGMATAPIYMAHDKGLPVHVLPARRGREIRAPRSRPGARSSRRAAYRHRGQCRGHLMQRGLVDLVIVGADRVTAQGDVCNKIGHISRRSPRRHQRAVLCGVVVADDRFPHHGGNRCIPIEERSADEVSTVIGKTREGASKRCRSCRMVRRWQIMLSMSRPPGSLPA